MTITEALAQIKTINARIEKKREFVRKYCCRQRIMNDPYSETGGTAAQISKELQALDDLQAQVVALRLAILNTNLATTLTVAGRTMTVQGWLTWRREVAHGAQSFTQRVLQEVEHIRKESLKNGGNSGDGPANSQYDITVQINEPAFVKDYEQYSTILGELDGALSVINATTPIII